MDIYEGLFLHMEEFSIGQQINCSAEGRQIIKINCLLLNSGFTNFSGYFFFYSGKLDRNDCVVFFFFWNVILILMLLVIGQP